MSQPGMRQPGSSRRDLDQTPQHLERMFCQRQHTGYLQGCPAMRNFLWSEGGHPVVMVLMRRMRLNAFNF
eukprot:3817929-Amphidinium_carterae.1